MSHDVILAFSGSSSHSYLRRRDFYAFKVAESSVVKVHCSVVIVVTGIKRLFWWIYFWLVSDTQGGEK